MRMNPQISRKCGYYADFNASFHVKPSTRNAVANVKKAAVKGAEVVRRCLQRVRSFPKDQERGGSHFPAEALKHRW